MTWPEGVPRWDEQRARVAAGASWASVAPGKSRAPHSQQGAPHPPAVAPPAAPPPPNPGRVPPPRPARRAPEREAGRDTARDGLAAARAGVARGPARAASRYVTLVTDGRRLCALDGRSRELGAITTGAELLRAARPLAGALEPVVWAHGSACTRLGLDTAAPPDEPPPFFAGLRRWGQRHTGWWWGLEEPGHPAALLAIAPWGDFALAPTVAELVVALIAWESAVGAPFAYSGAAVVGELIRSDHGRRRLTTPALEPVLEPEPWRECAWAFGHHWHREPAAWELRERRWVRSFDRNASYLAAWSGLSVGDGAWREGWLRCDAGEETTKPAAYWLLELEGVREWLRAYGYPDPFARQRPLDGSESPGPGLEWVTTPLAQLAGELGALAGVEPRCERVWWQLEKWRPLDNVAGRLRDARAELVGRSDLAGELGRAALKEGYAGATARFRWLADHGKADDKLARPYWCAAVRDRAAANTWRAIDRCAEPPIALGKIDRAAWCVPEPGAVPPGLRIGAGLGAWKPEGGALELERALELLERGGPVALYRELDAC